MYQKRYRVVFQLASLSCPLFIPTRQIKKKLAEMYVCFSHSCNLFVLTDYSMRSCLSFMFAFFFFVF
jgi:hypothetical protein